MPHRYTMKELETLTDYELIALLIVDRKEKLTNPYTPLTERLNVLARKIEKKSELTK